MDTSKQIQDIIDRATLLNARADQIKVSVGELIDAVKQLYENTETPIATIFSQRDPAWAKDNMGVSGGTIAKYGCLMCCLASILKDAGYDTDPRRLNAWLNANGGYVNGANLSNFALIESFKVVKLVRPVIFTPTPSGATVALDKARATIDAGGFATVMVDFNGAPHSAEKDVAMHWVRWLGVNDTVMEPWEGKIMPISPRFGKTPSVSIWRVALYQKA